MPRRFAFFAVAAVGLTALAPMASAAKLYLVETTDSGFSLHLSHAERRALGQDFGGYKYPIIVFLMTGAGIEVINHLVPDQLA